MGNRRATIADAVSLWRVGRHQDAERACTALLASARDPVATRTLLAEIYTSRGHFRAASEQLQQVAELNAGDAASWRRLGDAQHAAGDCAAAAHSFRRAIELEPRNARAHNNLGRALAQLRQSEAAIECFRRAIALDSAYAIAYNNLGMALAECGQHEEALNCYAQAVALNPRFSEAFGNQGNLLLRLGRTEDALQCFERSLALAPNHATMLCNAGSALLRLRRFTPALGCYDRALRSSPDFPLALAGRGNVLKEMKRYEEALACYERASILQPEDMDIPANKAGILLDQERFEAAIACCDRILEQSPDHPQALLIRGLALNCLGGQRYEEAVSSFARLTRVWPSKPGGLGLLFHASSMIFDWSHWPQVTEAERMVRDGREVINPLPLLGLTDNAALQLRCARTCIASTHPPAAEPIWRGERWRNPKIRIAYVSGDLRDHPLAYLMIGTFEKHDRERFEIIGVSLRPPVNNAFGARILDSLDAFIDVENQTDAQVARLLHQMQIDVVVDLMGNTRGQRMNIFAHRPAPVQVNYLGFPGTSGAAYFDYILADEFVIPPASREHYSESVVYLPDCFQANDDRRAIAPSVPSRAEAGLPDGAFVFCTFNSSYKITPAMFERWCRLLQARPDSVLWMLAESPLARAHIAREAASRGVDPQRLIFAARAPYDQHLARMSLADLFLDSLPFNAGATASDALWAGLPVLTCPGEAFAARMAGSLLRAAGLPELIAPDLESYHRRALELSASRDELAALRARLAVNRSTGPLFDTERFCRHLEAAYTTMHARHLAGLPPAHFSVPASSACKRP